MKGFVQEWNPLSLGPWARGHAIRLTRHRVVLRNEACINLLLAGHGPFSYIKRGFSYDIVLLLWAVGLCLHVYMNSLKVELLPEFLSDRREILAHLSQIPLMQSNVPNF